MRDKGEDEWVSEGREREIWGGGGGGEDWFVKGAAMKILDCLGYYFFER